jgi:hypothetical protein
MQLVKEGVGYNYATFDGAEVLPTTAFSYVLPWPMMAGRAMGWAIT